MKLPVYIAVLVVLAITMDRFRRGTVAGFVTTLEVWTISGNEEVTTAGQQGGGSMSPNAYLYMIVSQASQMIQHKIGMALQIYYMPLICIIGLIGNLLSIIIMFQEVNRNISSCIYISALALSDTICLLVALSHWVMTDTPIISMRRPMGENRWDCKIGGYISAAAQLTSVFIVCAMTSERLMAIRTPLRARRFCNPKRTRMTIFILAIAASIIRAPYILHTEPLGAGDCIAYLVKAPWITCMYWLNIMVSYWGPFFILLVMNCVIIHTIHTRRKYFEADKSSTEPGVTQEVSISHADVAVKQETKEQPSSVLVGVENKSFSPDETVDNGSELNEKKMTFTKKTAQEKWTTAMSAREAQLTVMLLTVTFTFLILLLPIYARHIVYQVLSYLSSPKAYADYILVANIGIKLIYTNNAVNFYLYCLSGSKFRSDLKKLLCFWLKDI